MNTKNITVSFLNKYIKKSIDCDYILNNLSVKGEISNFKLHSSGHIYFSLKDNFSKINCVMFKLNALTLRFIPKNGDKVIIDGRVSVYEKDGSYQLYCNLIKKDGIGDLHIAFEELKEELSEKGLFDEEGKKPIPKYPQSIGIITSPTGAAIRDIINVSRRRNNKIKLLIYPSLVQGDTAFNDLIDGINYFNKTKNVDAIILARGGGSIEELWAFNNRELAYAIHESEIPIVTGIGHETDFTIADFVGDLRASTPSVAAEILTPCLKDIMKEINSHKDLLNKTIINIVKGTLNEIESLEQQLKLYSPENYVVHQYEIIDSMKSKLIQNIKFKVFMEKELLVKYNSLLNAYSPLNILNKGYTIIEDKYNNIISTRSDFINCDRFNIRLKDGIVKASIKVLEE